MLQIQRLGWTGVASAQSAVYNCINPISKPFIAFQRARTQHELRPLKNLFLLTETLINRNIPTTDKQVMIDAALKQCDIQGEKSLHGRVFKLSQDIHQPVETKCIKSIQQVVEKKLFHLTLPKQNHLFEKLFEIAKIPATGKEWEICQSKVPLPLLIGELENLEFSVSASTSNHKKYFDSFDEIASSKTCSYQLNRKDLRNGRIGYINGMGCSFEQAVKDAVRLSDHIAQQYNLHCIHSSYHGSVASENAVKLLKQQWIDFFKLHSSASKYLQICHSNGATHVKNALESMDEAIRQKIIVVSIAPAVFLPKGLCLQSFHYLIKNDPIPIFALFSKRMFNQTDEGVIVLPDHEDGSHPHDPHGSSYTNAIEKVVRKYIDESRVSLT